MPLHIWQLVSLLYAAAHPGVGEGLGGPAWTPLVLPYSNCLEVVPIYLLFLRTTRDSFLGILSFVGGCNLGHALGRAVFSLAGCQYQ